MAEWFENKVPMHCVPQQVAHQSEVYLPHLPTDWPQSPVPVPGHGLRPHARPAVPEAHEAPFQWPMLLIECLQGGQPRESPRGTLPSEPWV